MHRFPATVEREVHDLLASLRADGARLAELLAGDGLASLSEAALPDLALGLLEVGDRVTASATCVVARVHASGSTLPDGHVSVSRWLQAQAGVSSGTAAQLVARGRAVLDDHHAVREAWLAGDVTGDKVRAITTGADGAVRALPASVKELRRQEAAAFLLERAGRYRADELARRGKHIRSVLDPDGTDLAALDAHDAQQLVFARVGDGVQVSGFLSAETAAQIQCALDRVVDGWYQRGELPVEQRDPDGSDPDDPRVLRARRVRRPHLDALALAEICGAATESGSLGTKHGALPRVTLTADLDTLSTLGGELHDPRHETPSPVPPSSMLRLLCDATVLTVVTLRADGCAEGTDLLREASREVLYVGHEERTITPGPARSSRRPLPALRVPRLPRARVALPRSPRAALVRGPADGPRQPGARLPRAPPPGAPRRLEHPRHRPGPSEARLLDLRPATPTSAALRKGRAVSPVRASHDDAGAARPPGPS